MSPVNNETSKLAFLLENSFGIAYELMKCCVIQNNLNSSSNSIYTTDLKPTSRVTSSLFGSPQLPQETPSSKLILKMGLILQKGALKLRIAIFEESMLIQSGERYCQKQNSICLPALKRHTENGNPALVQKLFLLLPHTSISFPFRCPDYSKRTNSSYS